MLSTSAADSTVDSFHTAQEGSSVCIHGEKGALRMDDCKLDEVTSKVSSQHPSNKQKHHADTSQGVPPLSISASPLKKGAGPTAPSRAPSCVLISKQLPLRKPSPETPPSRKRLCVGVLASQPATPDISPRQLSSSAIEVRPAAAPAAAQLSQQTSARPEVSGSQPHRRGSCQVEIRDVPMLHTDTQHAYSSSMDCSLRSKVHPDELVAELTSGQTSPSAKPQVLTLPEYSH